MKINNKARQAIVKGWDSTAYIFPDGIMVVQRKEITFKVAGVKTSETKYVYFPTFGAIDFYAHNGDKPTRIVCHNASVVLDGIQSVRVYHGNKSESSEEQGIVFETITLKTDSGAKHRENILPFISADSVPQYHNETLASMVAFVRTERSYILIEAA